MSPAPARPAVTAVLVAHDGVHWLPRTLDALAQQTQPVDRLLVVDTGSQDGTPDLVHNVGADLVLTLRRNTSFGAAVARALAGAPALVPAVHGRHAASSAPAGQDGVEGTTPDDQAVGGIEWVWLLHDDSAPAPTALAELLALAEQMPSVAVFGPKLRGWDNPSVLLEAGVTIDHGGRRETGLERDEVDQGQHDRVRDVLSVSTAGMLVRRDVWEAMGGLDPALPLFRDDLDFGWRLARAGHRVVVCPRAVVHHAEAAASRQRPLDATYPKPRRADRAAALYTLMVNGSALWLPVTVLRLAVGTVLRALALLLAKRPEDAWDELVAAGRVFSRPHRIVAGRRARAQTSTVAARHVGTLLAPVGTRARHYTESVRDRLAGRSHDGLPERAPTRSLLDAPADADDVDDAYEDFEDVSEGPGILRRLITLPGVVLTLALIAVTLLAERKLMHGGVLYGGALLPTPRGASDLWATYAAAWHPTGLGSSAAAPPYLVPVATVATLLFGNARLAVELLLLASVPIAGMTAYGAAKLITPSTLLRVWAAATYALLPVATGAIAGGRLGSAIACALLPLLLRALAGAMLRREELQSLRPAWIAGLTLAVVCAFEPVTWFLIAPLAIVFGVVGAVRRRRRAPGSALVILGVPFILLLPWSWQLIDHPATFLLGVGLPEAGAAHASPLEILLLRPGGPGMPPIWVGAGLLAAGLIGLLRDQRRHVAWLGWSLAFVGLAGGFVISRLTGHLVAGSGSQGGWPGMATALIGVGLLLATLVATTGARTRLATMNFSWRQPIVVVVAAFAALTPVVAGASWVVRGADDPLGRSSAEVLPAFISGQAHVQATGGRTDDMAARSLVLQRAANGSIRYALLRGEAPTLGVADLAPDTAQVAAFDSAVADLAAGDGASATEALAHLGVRYVLVPGADETALARTLDGAGGLNRVGSTAATATWKVVAPSGRLSMVYFRPEVWRPLDFTGLGQPVAVTPSPSYRLAVLTEAASRHWRATVDGKALEATDYHGQQAFVLPEKGGQLVVSREPAVRTGWMLFGAVGLLTVIILAMPAGRRS